MIDKAFGWWRSWISFAIALLAFCGGLALAGKAVNLVIAMIARVICTLLGIGS